MNNIIAASILALGMIVSAAIIYFAPRPGRFQWKDDSLNENMIDVKLFDTARGLVYFAGHIPLRAFARFVRQSNKPARNVI